jgi:hypothetical protein
MKEMNELLAKFFRQKWQLFSDEIRLGLPSDPGVYALAYTTSNLAGQTVKTTDVFYVGMSNASQGLKQRLNQFHRGIRKGDMHSGGMRFLKNYLKGTSYDPARSRKKFWVAHLSLPCDVKKERRTPNDLRTMGKVSCLEYFILARVRQGTGDEPELNLK